MWPYVERTSSPDGSVTTFGDLRFVSTNPVMERFLSGRRQPFVLKAHLDESGNLRSWSFSKGASSFDESLEH
jgi:inner membrane protein